MEGLGCSWEIVVFGVVERRDWERSRGGIYIEDVDWVFDIEE